MRENLKEFDNLKTRVLKLSDEWSDKFIKANRSNDQQKSEIRNLENTFNLKVKEIQNIVDIIKDKELENSRNFQRTFSEQQLKLENILKDKDAIILKAEQSSVDSKQLEDRI